MATTLSYNNLKYESDGAYITLLEDCDFGNSGASMWISASTARMLIAQGKAVLSNPAPKQ
jgi:hypothetical protein